MGGVLRCSLAFWRCRRAPLNHHLRIRGVLMEADRAFDAAVADGGSQAWGGGFAEDGAIVQEGRGEVRGRVQHRLVSTPLVIVGYILPEVAA